MTSFEKDKAAKLKRQPLLWIFNAIGMVAWRDDGYGGAKQNLRRVHPLSLVWLLAMTLGAVVTIGIPETIKELKSAWKGETVWW